MEAWYRLTDSEQDHFGDDQGDEIDGEVLSLEKEPALWLFDHLRAPVLCGQVFDCVDGAYSHGSLERKENVGKINYKI